MRGAVLRLAAVAAALASTAVTVPAAGQEYEDYQFGQDDWQRPKEPPPTPDEFEFAYEHFALEVRFAPYWPEVDEEFGGSATPFEDTFGGQARVYFGLELDWLPLRIPYVGALGPSFSWGYTRCTGRGIVVSTGQQSESDTALNIMPMYVAGVLRADYLLRKWGIPVVPYGKVGLGMGLWKTSGAGRTSRVGDTLGKGTAFGLHLGLGGAIALTAFDPTSQASMKDETGIESVNLFGEWMWANLDGIGSHPAMHVGTSTVAFGLGVDW